MMLVVLTYLLTLLQLGISLSPRTSIAGIGKANALLLLFLVTILALLLLTSLLWAYIHLLWTDMVRGKEGWKEAKAQYENLREQYERMTQENEKAERRREALDQLNEQLIDMQKELEASYRKVLEENRLLEAQALTDAVTGLTNRYALEQALRAQALLAQRHHQPLTLLMMDVDHFKQYNDRFGHPAGDEALRIIGDLLRQTIRASDVAARYGGEEFVILLPQTDQYAGEEIAHRIREAVSACSFPHDRLRVSIGLATLNVHAEDAEGLLRAADKALYMAKQTGRDCVQIAQPLESVPPDPASLHLVYASRSSIDSPLLSLKPSSFPTVPLFVEEYDPFGGLEGLMQESSGSVLVALLAALDLRDHDSHGHSQRVARFSLTLARQMLTLYESQPADRANMPQLTPGDLRELAMGALLHDIGKIHIPDSLLRKRSALTDQEWALIRLHPVIGAELIRHFPVLAPALPVVLHHHERWDGQGYPLGLAGEDIPLTARIFAICDVFDVLTSDRPYRRACSHEEAYEEIRRQAGKQFDPEIVPVFLQIQESTWQHLRQEYVRAAA